MKSTLLSAAVVAMASATAPPRIELNLGEATNVGRLTQLTPFARHATGLTQPSGLTVQSRQDYTQACAVGSTVATCNQPTALAYDHQDGTVAVVESIWQTDLNNVATSVDVTSSGGVDFSKRSSYLIKFDATDDAGNKAEQVVFAQIVDDFVAPTITVCNGVAETVQAADATWTLCESQSADTYDGDVTASVRYTIEYMTTNQVLVTAAPYATAASFINVDAVGDYKITMTAWDQAGQYGVDGVNNQYTTVKTVTVADSANPWLDVAGSFPTETHECAVARTDSGATCKDALDTVALGKVLAYTTADTTDPNTVGTYTATYNCQDSHSNVAPTVVRTVNVEDNTVPTIALRGPATQSIYAGKTIKDEGVDTADTCCTAEPVVTTSWSPSAPTTTLGAYVRTYTATDCHGLTNTITRDFTLVDDMAPVITITGADVMTVEADLTQPYNDQGATCQDYVEDAINAAVVISWDAAGPANRMIPGLYTATYSCSDTSANDAATQERKVYIVDSTCPDITMLGTESIFVEAGFAYQDAGATASDTLDGVITSQIFTDGDTVDVSNSFYSRQSCSEIKATFPVKAVAQYGTAATGDYWITTDVSGTFTRQSVYCDMNDATGITYKRCDNCDRVGVGTGDSCLALGMVRATTVSAVAQSHFNSAYWAVADSDNYLCTTATHDVADKAHFRDVDATSTIGHAEAGKFVIRYLVTDNAGNVQCTAPKRTVVVQDTLPPVISLHLNNKLVHLSGHTKQGHGSVANPAGQVDGNPFLRADYVPPAGYVSNAFSLMAETQSSSVNGWIVGAAASGVTGLALLAYARK